jgi:hypothetical protein
VASVGYRGPETTVSSLGLRVLLAAGFLRRLRRKRIWKTALYVEALAFAPGEAFASEPCLFESNESLRPRARAESIADPFLIQVDGALFLLVEGQSRDGASWIEAFRTEDCKSWDYVGEVLREDHHISYPCVFRDGDRLFMIPETKQANAVFLYEFDQFPLSLRKVRTLLHGRYVDTTPVRHDGLWYIFSTTEEKGLELFSTPDLVAGELTEHPCSPITNDLQFRRCGGLPIEHDGVLLRIAQDCSSGYGRNLNLLEITTLTPADYREKLHIQGVFSPSFGWKLGGHHLSWARWGSQTVVAVDGQSRGALSAEFPRVLRVLRRLLRPEAMGRS